MDSYSGMPSGFVSRSSHRRGSSLFAGMDELRRAGYYAAADGDSGYLTVGSDSRDY